MFCPLCHNTESTKFHEDKFREYLKCKNCELVFVPAEQYVSSKKEKARYDEHNNDAGDERYVAFLSKVLNPMLAQIKPGDVGLDFGSGPEPVLAGLFNKKGFEMAIYDLFYAKNEEVFKKYYDFITATEVVEHLHQPKKELDRLWNCLKPGGILGIMTKSYEGMDFKNWNYKNDCTHVCFFAKKSFEWLAEELGAELEFVGEEVIFIKKDSL